MDWGDSLYKEEKEEVTTQALPVLSGEQSGNREVVWASAIILLV